MSSPSLIARARNLLKFNTRIEKRPDDAQRYLHGLRGLLTISSFLWVFFQTFIPALVSGGTAGPTYQKILRCIFAPTLWDESLLSSFFIALSARAICVRFLKDPNPTAFAGSIIRRIVRFSLAVGLASGIASAIFKSLGTEYIQHFKQILPNDSIPSLDMPHNGLTALNAIFDLFWVVRSYYYQAANSFWPSQTIWALSVVYQQSWTVYFLMVILPFTRATWHFSALLLFSAGSFWMDSWGWYNATSLLLADYVINTKLRARLNEGLNIKEDWNIPFAVPAMAMIIGGFAMKYVWTALPQYVNAELYLHPWLDLAESTTRDAFAIADPYPRVDNYLVIFGTLLLVETTNQVRDLLSARWLVSLGRRSLSK